MYSTLALAKKYFKYYRKASNSKGHGVHSPFVFDFIIHVLNDQKRYDCYSKIEAIRYELLHNNDFIEVRDFGAGSSVFSSNKRQVKKIAASSLKKKKYAQLLFRIARYYQCITIVELGTSFGITTSYLASANPQSKVYTFEGAPSIAAIAQENFAKNDVANIELTLGDFSETLPDFSNRINKIDFLFIDGNHRKEPTVGYFEQFLPKAHNDSIFIFDDIHWSEEMEAAWEKIKSHESVRLSIDLFFIGIVLFKSEFKVKQHFSIRF